MSRDYRHGQKQVAKSPRKQTKQQEPTARPDRGPSKQRQEDVLRHAVRTQDFEPLEDDDWSV